MKNKQKKKQESDDDLHMRLARIAIEKQLRKPFFNWKRVLVDDVKSCFGGLMLVIICMIILPCFILWFLFKCLFRSLPLIIAIVSAVLILKWMGVI